MTSRNWLGVSNFLFLFKFCIIFLEVSSLISSSTSNFPENLKVSKLGNKCKWYLRGTTGLGNLSNSLPILEITIYFYFYDQHNGLISLINNLA